MSKHKYIETPEKLWSIFQQYVQETKARRRQVPKATPRGIVIEEHIPPLTMAGFEVFCFQNHSDCHHYFDNTDGRYEDYRTICSHIKKVIREDQVEGGMVGQYNSSITQRLNGLTEKTETTTTSKNVTEIVFKDPDESDLSKD